MGIPAKLKVPQSDTALLVIDVQERLFPAMEEGLRTRLLQNLVRLGEASRILQLPVLISEQYPKGLGATVPELRRAFEGVMPMDKLSFDANGDPAIAGRLRGMSRRTLVVAGMETHVCVFQTVRSLVADGYQVHLLADAVASRSRDNYQLGLELAREAGALISSTETVLFDMLERAGSETFKAISKLVR